MASGIWKLNWGWPAANPPSTDCGFQPAQRDHPGADVAAFGRGHVAEASYVVGCDAVLHLCGAPATGDDGGPIRTPNAPALEVCGHRGQPGSEVGVVPVDDRTLGKVSQERFTLGSRR